MQKIGILGGGQLGKMLLQAAANYPVETYVMDLDNSFPAAHLCHHFIKGNIKNYDDVIAFGKKVDSLTIEIEDVNIDALEELEKMGVTIIPKPSVLRMVKNKILQKNFYALHNIPTPAFVITSSVKDVEANSNFLPAVHKISEGGYDGKGVQLLPTANDIDKAFNAPAVLEKMVDIEKEIAVIAAVSQQGDIVLFPPVEMIFDPQLNLLDIQLSPAYITSQQASNAERIAREVFSHLQSPGLFAIELFIDKNGDVLVNEMAPRVHNSGHHTIEAHYCSQYDMLIRILMDLPLGNVEAHHPSVLINLIGAPGYSGEAKYEGIENLLAMPNTYIHIYGKKETRPGRKMGHITALCNTQDNLLLKANELKKMVVVKSM